MAAAMFTKTLSVNGTMKCDVMEVFLNHHFHQMMVLHAELSQIAQEKRFISVALFHKILSQNQRLRKKETLDVLKWRSVEK